MPITDELKRVALASIVVARDTRQRQEGLDIDDLKSSIERRGLIHPIIVDRELRLVAGERRLESCRALGWLDIPVRFVEDMSSIELELIELEENVKRKDLGWKDLVKATARIHQLYSKLDEDWTQDQTADAISLNAGQLSLHLRVERALSEGDERVGQASTVREAYNILARRDQRAAGDALMELIEDSRPRPEGAELVSSPTATGPQIVGLPSPKPGSYPPSPIIQPAGPPAEDLTILGEDFIKWAPAYEGKKFNFIHCDFPYGIEVFSGPQARGAEPSQGYKDGFNLYIKLLETLCNNLNRLMSVSGHMMFWYSDKHRAVTLHTFQKLAPSLAIHPYPLIWVKSDNAGIASDPKHGPRHVYETALLLSRGQRPVVKVKADAYSAPTDKLLHPSTKPEPMLRHFFEMLVDDSTSMLDPTCGSGASIRAAESLGASRTLGLEIDPNFAHSARLALKMARMKHRAAERARQTSVERQ